MRLKTIWTLPAMSLRERVRRTNELMLIWIAHRLPRGLAYRSFIDSGVRHIRDDEVVPEVPFVTLLSRMER